MPRKKKSDLNDLEAIATSKKPKSKIRCINTKVAGVSQRQSEVHDCHPGEILLLSLEPNNPVDRNAIKVLRKTNVQIGYVSSDLAEELQNQLKDGYGLFALIKQITGGSPDKPTFGCNISVVLYKDIDQITLDNYIAELMKDVNPYRNYKSIGFLERLFSLFR